MFVLASSRGLLGESDDGDDPIPIHSSRSSEMRDQAALCLVGRVWSHKPYNSFALIKIMRKLWNPTYGFTCMEIENNLFSFQFNNARDAKKIMNVEPWHFSKHVLVLKQVEMNVQPSAMVFDSASFWIRIYGIPLSGRTNTVLQNIANRIGSFVAFDEDTLTGLGRSVRMKVKISLDKPLEWGIKVAINDAGPIWLPV